ncbi:MAG TPA: shikimate dehydrogenase [Steroidobacteraceae bacterium]
MKVPDRYAVLGHPVSHSRSPWIHARFAAQTAQAMSYEAIDVEPANLAPFVREFFAGGGRGLNITLPHKMAAAALATKQSEAARTAGAVNTLWPDPAGRLCADNTDGVGLARDLAVNLGIELAGRRLLLLGAGGAARGILAALLEAAPAELVIANRTLARAEELAVQFAGAVPVRAVAFEDLLSPGFDLIINATSASLAGDSLALSPKLLGFDTVCYDLAYQSGGTMFVHWAQEHGVRRAYGGIGMLIEQAAESFRLWRGVRPDTAPLLAELSPYR